VAAGGHNFDLSPFGNDATASIIMMEWTNFKIFRVSSQQQGYLKLVPIFKASNQVTMPNDKDILQLTNN
jgi:hypothetical protein